VRTADHDVIILKFLAGKLERAESKRNFIIQAIFFYAFVDVFHHRAAAKTAAAAKKYIDHMFLLFSSLLFLWMYCSKKKGSI
jgi:hypothetical protein